MVLLPWPRALLLMYLVDLVGDKTALCANPFATTEGSADIAPELDLFAMRPSDTGAAAAITPPTSSEAPTIVAPIAAPAAPPLLPPPPPPPPQPPPTPPPQNTFTSPAAAPPAPATAPAAAPAPEALSPPKAEPAPVIDLLGTVPHNSFSGPVEETQSSAPGGPGDDLLGGLMSPTLAPTAAPALAPLAPARRRQMD
ncbi:hypothetical protein INR49_026680 [Caranx melampygus]|nr:hypothetical protein INR49_026680 [Caranx melampygus]